jgi:hypothetical protein
MNSNTTELSLPTPRECIDTDSANDFATRKRPRSLDRCEIRTQAAQMLAPKYTNQSIQDIESMDWVSTEVGDVKRNQQLEDEKDTRAINCYTSRQPNSHSHHNISLSIQSIEQRSAG